MEHSKDETYILTEHSEDVNVGCEILRKHNILVMFAKAGSEKSKTSLQIAIRYQDELYTPMLFVNTEITKTRDLINFNHTNIVIVEEFLGRSNININEGEDKHDGVLDVLYSCAKSESCKTKLILMIRGDEKSNRKFIEKHRIFDKKTFMDTNRSCRCNNSILSKLITKYCFSLRNCPFCRSFFCHDCCRKY